MTTGLHEAAYGGPSVFVEATGRRIPPPLRIIKREDKGKASHGGPRKLSSETDESFGSAPEPPGGDAPITIPKRRSQGGSSSPGWLSKENERLATPVYDLEHEDVPTGGDTPRPRRANSCAMPRRPKQHPLAPAPSKKASLVFSERKRGTPLLKPAEPFPRHGGSISELSVSTPISSTGKSGRPTLSGNSMPHLSPLSSPDLGGHGATDGIFDNSQQYYLVPKIEVTPESHALDEGVNALWTAVVISNQLCRATSLGQAQSVPSNQFGSATDYGYLYDVDARITATSSSSVIEVLEDKSAPTTLHLGSRLLLLAHIQLVPMTPPRKSHKKQHSEDLIQDLEYQLGSTTTEYLNIKMSFRHSAFPKLHPSPSRTGLSRTYTTIQTCAAATIKRHNTSSPWSPRPAPQSNPLFSVIAANWGADAANDVMYRIFASRSTPRKAANMARALDSGRTDPQKDGASTKSASILAAPVVPRRRASLRRRHAAAAETISAPVRGSSSSGSSSSSDSDSDQGPDPARKIWTEMRKLSMGKNYGYRIRQSESELAPTSPRKAMDFGLRNTSGKGGDPVGIENVREPSISGDRFPGRAGTERKTSAGMGALKALVGADTESRIEGGRRQIPGSRVVSREKVSGENRKKEKETGRWGWVSWW